MIAPFDRLDRYVARTFLSSWLASTALFMGLFGVVDFFSNVGDLIENAKSAGAGLNVIARLYACKAPGIFVQVAPFVMLLSALFTVLRLQRHGELMAMFMTGRSALRVLAPVFGMTVLCMFVLVAAQEVLIPRLAQQREADEALLVHGDPDWVLSTTIKDASGNILRVVDYHVASETISKLHASGRDETGRNRLTYGENAVYDEAAGGWRLQNGRMEVRAPDSPVPEITEPAAFFRTDVRPQDLLNETQDPFDLSYRDVLERSERYPQAARWRLLRHYHITYPLSVLLLVMLGLPFVLKRRHRGSLVGLGISLLLCLAYLTVDVIVRDLGTRGFLSPVIAAWFPVILAGSLGVVLFDTLEA
jgi:lipopolysaccharide export system permease protein